MSDPFGPIELDEFGGSSAERLQLALSADNDAQILSAYRLLEASGRPLELNPREQMRLADSLARGGMHIQAVRLYQELRLEQTPEADFKIATLWLGPGLRPEEGLALLDQLIAQHPEHPLRAEAETILAQARGSSPPPGKSSISSARPGPTSPKIEPPEIGGTPPSELSPWGQRFARLTGPVGSTRFKWFMRLVLATFFCSLLGLATGSLSKDRYRELSEVHPALLEDPVQTKLDLSIPIAHDLGSLQVRLNPLYDYEMAGLLVSKHDYGNWLLKDGDDVAPTDLCLIWGGNIAKGYYRSPELEFHQNLRKCYVSRVCGTHFVLDDFSNNHVVAGPEIQSQLDALVVGDQIRLRGALVNIRAKRTGSAMQALGFGSGQFAWNTSTKRSDKGMGACEVVYVREIEVLGRAPRWPHRLLEFSFAGLLLAFALLLLRAGLLPFEREPRRGPSS